MIEHFFNNGIKYSTKVCDRIIGKMFNDYQLNLGDLKIIQLSDDELLQVNKDFLNHDYYTDIITFTLNTKPIEGELYISYERVLENEKLNSSKNEIYRIVFHGCLHLIGFEDFTKELKKQIHILEDKYLELVPRETIY